MTDEEKIEDVTRILDHQPTKAEKAFEDIEEWSASGQGSYTGAYFFRHEISNIVADLSDEVREQVWQLIVNNLGTSESIEDIGTYAEIFGKKGHVEVKWIEDN